MAQSMNQIFADAVATDAKADQAQSTGFKPTALPPGIHPVTGKKTVADATGVSPIADKSAHVSGTGPIDDAIKQAVLDAMKGQSGKEQDDAVDIVNQVLNTPAAESTLSKLPNISEMLPTEELAKVASSLNYVPSEGVAVLFEKEDALTPKEMLAIVTDVYRNAYQTAVQHSGFVTQQYVNKAQPSLVQDPIKQGFTANADKQALQAKVAGLDGVTKSVRSNLEGIMGKVRASQPDASPDWIADQVMAYVDSMKGGAPPAPTPIQTGPKKTDWKAIFGTK